MGLSNFMKRLNESSQYYSMARLEVPCLILDEDELAKGLGEWRQDRHNLEAARIFGGPAEAFPSAFHRTRKAPRIDTKKSLVDRVRLAFRIPSVPKDSS
jgi:hypothetical protein